MNDTMNYIFGSLSKGWVFMTRQTKLNIGMEVCLLFCVLCLRNQQQKINELQATLEEIKNPKGE